MKTESSNNRPGFMFWALAPFLLSFLVALPFIIPDWQPTSIIIMVGLEMLALFVFLGLLNPDRFWWAWRAVGALIFIAYLACLVLMLVESGGKITAGERRSEPSVFNAACGLFVFGLPGLIYAIRGQLISK